MDIWVFGNPDLQEDALPVRLLPRLQDAFPIHHFVLQDPLDEWQLPQDTLTIIDTVKGIDRVTAFTSLEAFQSTPHVTMHDYDLWSELKIRQKIGPLPALTILGVPPELSDDEAFAQLSAELQARGSN